MGAVGMWGVAAMTVWVVSWWRERADELKGNFNSNTPQFMDGMTVDKQLTRGR